MSLVADQLVALSNRLRVLDGTIAELSEQRTDAAAELADLVDGQAGVINAHGRPVARISYSRRWNENKAREYLTESQLVTCSVLALSSSKAKLHLSPYDYEQCQKYSDTPTVTAVDPA